MNKYIYQNLLKYMSTLSKLPFSTRRLKESSGKNKSTKETILLVFITFRFLLAQFHKHEQFSSKKMSLVQPVIHNEKSKET